MAGTPESSWHVVRRCMAIIRRTQQGGAGWRELLQAVRAVDPDAYGSSSDAALRRKVQRDVARIRESMKIDIGVESGREYVIRDWGDGVFDLSDQELDTLAFLRQTFDLDAPYGQQVSALVESLVHRFAAERQRQFNLKSTIGPDIEFRLRDEGEISADVWSAVYKAWHEKRELEFAYLKPSHQGVARHHRIQPWKFYFSERGRYMLHGFCLELDGPHGSWQARKYFDYRLHYIVPGSVKVLPTKLPPVAPRGRLIDVVIEVSPQISVFGLGKRPEWEGKTRRVDLADGWVRIEGRIEEGYLFTFSRNLLFYAEGCRVIGGEELRGAMVANVSALAEIYA